MNVVSVSQVSKRFGEKVLFENLTLGINKGDKAALVGINGSGKSTLLEIIAGILTPDTGEVVIRNETIVSLLSQNPILDYENTILEEFYKIQNESISLILEYENLIRNENDINFQGNRLEDVIHKLDANELWNYESHIKQILGKLGLYNLEQKIGILSGGQQKRVAIAKALLEEPELLILDEPTNHLDLETIEWLENYLTNQSITLLLVTHDRYFLEKITNRIIEIDQGELFNYPGNYENYLIKKSEREEILKRGIDKARNLLRKELDWMRRMPKARGSKSRERIDRFYELEKKAQKKIDKQELILDTYTSRIGKKILEIKNVSLNYDGISYIKNFSYTFKRFDRIGVIGPNGCGKSSLMDLITERVHPNEGMTVKGSTLHVGYYTQKEFEFDPEQRVIDIIRKKADIFRMPDGKSISASQMLEHFQFSASQQYDFIRKLSGGEKSRLQLLLVLIENPNFLILDEPTNDLDLITLSILEDFLEGFKGCLIIVSHDRYFMDRLVDHLFVFSGNGIIDDFPGNYTDFRSSTNKKSNENTDIAPKKQKSKPGKNIKKQKLNFNEKREFDSLSKELEELEASKEELLSKMNQGTENHSKLEDWSKEYEKIIQLIDKKSDRWLELSEFDY